MSTKIIYAIGFANDCGRILNQYPRLCFSILLEFELDDTFWDSKTRLLIDLEISEYDA